ncbi:MAG: hypothetical protein ACYC3S_00435 [Chloroflexota bacterium]
MSQMNESSVKKPQEEKAVAVTVRTPAGITHVFEVHSHDRVDKTARTAVTYFSDQGQLANEPHGLALVRDGQAVEMQDSARLEDYEVAEGDLLALLPKAPQVDG